MKKKIKQFDFNGEYNFFYSMLEKKDWTLAKMTLRNWQENTTRIVELEKIMLSDYRGRRNGE